MGGRVDTLIVGGALTGIAVGVTTVAAYALCCPRRAAATAPRAPSKTAGSAKAPASRARSASRSSRRPDVLASPKPAAAPTSTVAAPAAPAPHWLARNPSKRWAETCFLAAAGIWVPLLAYVIATQWYETFGSWHYWWVGCVTAFSPALLCALTTPASERQLPFWSRHWVKAYTWMGVVTYVGNYFWTHYFYTMLKATYTFTAWRVNDVPVAMFLMTQGYFLLYHSGTNMALRRWYSSTTYAALPRWVAALGTACLVAVLSWVTAFMEAYTIQGFPYYAIADRSYMYTVGSIVYGIYFLATFPMFVRLDEDADVPAPKTLPDGSVAPVAPAAVPRLWTLSQAVIDALAACMIVTIALDLWRIGYNTAVATAGSEGSGFWAVVAALESGWGGLPWFA